MKNKSFFWTSYSDLMTSLFFVMLLLFVTTVIMMHLGHVATEKELEKIRHDCLDGSLRCGDCKAKASELMVEMFDEIHDRQDEAREIANNLI